MKKSFLIILIAASAASLTGCKKYLDVNTNPNALSSATEGLILSPVEEGMSSYVSAGYNSILVNYWMQTMTLNQVAPIDVTYVVTNSSFDGPWYNFYVTCMNNLYLMDQKATTNGNSTYAGIAKTLMAYTLGATTDLWGDVPYKEAFKGTNTTNPSYDSQESIYGNLQSLLDSAVAELGRATGTQPSGDDFFYSGDTGKWLKLAYSLKARYYMHLTKASGYTAATQAQLALTALQNGMTSYADDCYFPYAGGNSSSAPWYWNFFNTSTAVYNATYIDTLKARSDPRLPILATKAKNSGLYVGRVTANTLGDLNDYSVSGTFYGSETSNGYIFNSDEALFLKAEATYLVSGYSAAQPVYRAAITNNMLKLGLDTNSTAAQAYLTARGTLTSANALQRIMEEKVVANYLSPENYTDWRRTGYPSVTVVNSSLTNGITEVPRRFLYPLNETVSNPQTVQSAKITDRVWWDTK